MVYKTIAELKNELILRGFIIPEKARFFQTKINGIGMLVGEYCHSCHVEGSNIQILLHGDTNIQEYWDSIDYIEEVNE